MNEEEKKRIDILRQRMDYYLLAYVHCRNETDRERIVTKLHDMNKELDELLGGLDSPQSGQG